MNKQRLKLSDFIYFSALLSLLLLSSLAQAQTPDNPIYLRDGAVDGAGLIGPPPPLGSPEFNTQMAIVLWLRDTRTPEQVAFVKEKLNLNRFTPILGDELLDVDGIVLRQTLAGIIKEVRADYDAIKALYDQPRPFKVNPEVKPPVDARDVASYPSGHAVRAVVYARVLGEIFPDKKDELMDLALQIGYGRAIAGVHYPVDIVAGQVLGKAYADAIIESPSFKEALNKIKSQ